MGYLIAKIHDASTDLHVETLNRRHALRDPSAEEIRGLIESTGRFEMNDMLSHSPADQWPLTASVYTSQRPDGAGRCGSKLFAVAVREKTEHQQERKAST